MDELLKMALLINIDVVTEIEFKETDLKTMEVKQVITQRNSTMKI